MNKIINRLGEKHLTNEGYEVEIIEYFGSHNCTIRFLYNGLIKYNIAYYDIKTGEIRNSYHPSVCGVGYVGQGKYSPKKEAKAYHTWRGLLLRCYNKKSIEKHPTYKDCLVADEWHNFQNFAKWFEQNYEPHMQDWHLDKDILIKGKKVYSPVTCCFVPQDINSLFIRCNKSRGNLPIGVVKRDKKYTTFCRIYGKQLCLGRYNTPGEAFEVYKIAKENEIKRIADEWKHFIRINVYEAMYNYIVEITD